MRGRYWALTEAPKDLAVLFASLTDAFCRLNAENFGASDCLSLRNRGRLLWSEQKGLEKKDAARVIYHMQGVNLWQVVGFVDSNLCRQLIKPRLELESTRMKERYPLGPFV